jgi:hypothetical protein
MFPIEKAFRMSKHNLQARPIYHRTRDSIDAHLTIVFAALAVSRHTENTTGWSIKKFVKTTRLYRRLLPLLKAGLLQPDDRLVWHQSRLGNTFYATVLSRGALQLDGGRIAKSLSGACQELTGKSDDGREEFRREPDNVLLGDLRAQLAGNAKR